MELKFKKRYPAMRPNKAAVLVAVTMFVQLFSFAPSQAGPISISAPAAVQEFHQSVSLPPKDRLVFADRVEIIDHGQLLGEFVAYDDATTARPADYVELYNNRGELLAVSWFDRFGIERLALDEALVQSADHLAGTFVLIIGGDSI
jgi:hypothetical protein